MRRRAEQSGAGIAEKKYKGVRRRKWGKWVSEIRVPGSQERLWLGSYTTPEAAAVAHDVAFYCLRRPMSLDALNFPELLPASVSAELSPNSVQRAASDAGMGIDALIIVNKSMNDDDKMNVNGVIQSLETQFWEGEGSDYHCGTWEEQELTISVDDYDYLS